MYLFIYLFIASIETFFLPGLQLTSPFKSRATKQKNEKMPFATKLQKIYDIRDI